MFKISESLIQFEEQPLGKTEKGILESADRILQQYWSSQDKIEHEGADKPLPPRE
jgi:hypothetical protein